MTAFKALHLFIEKTGIEKIGLVCTGQTHDYRFPEYFDEIKNAIEELNLKNNIFILGYIQKQAQLALLSKSIAVIQPTRFEGGPGGGAVYESVAYGIRSIVSDIAVNKELDDSTVTFFSTGSADSLCDRMIEIYNAPYQQPSAEVLDDNSKQRLSNMGNALLSVINKTLDLTDR
jgi:glycosyltransferase involved in cell wall biosynthesis